MVHLSTEQERLKESLTKLSDPSNFPWNFSVSSHNPINVNVYPGVFVSPPFPLLSTPPVDVTPTNKPTDDVYVRSATGLAYTKSLEFIRRTLGPYFDFEKLWEAHTYYVSIDLFAIHILSSQTQNDRRN